MKDPIERQDAIDALTEAEVVGVCWKGGYIQRHNDFHEAINCVKELPSAEPRWIPMTERKPEVDQDVLVTTKNDGMYVVTYAFKEWTPGHCFHWKPCFMGTEYLSEEDVVAWMPLPEPYQEAEHE